MITKLTEMSSTSFSHLGYIKSGPTTISINQMCLWFNDLQRHLIYIKHKNSGFIPKHRYIHFLNISFGHQQLDYQPWHQTSVYCPAKCCPHSPNFIITRQWYVLRQVNFQQSKFQEYCHHSELSTSVAHALTHSQALTYICWMTTTFSEPVDM